tara:strand:+ start:2545 stop:4956 length:2412 start_codon:yes stop_codon:yes gene_type:complete
MTHDCKSHHSNIQDSLTSNYVAQPFVHLHVHTEYSLLDGINKVARLPTFVKSLGQPAVAMTDHGNISGCYRFYKECNKANIKPIIGMEAYYVVNDRSLKEPDELGKSYYHLILLAQNNIGLHNLIKLSSKSYTSGFYRKPRIDDALLADHSEGIIATTTCLGSRASQLILSGDLIGAEKLIHHHRAIFKDRFIIELQLHHDEEQQQVNKVLQKIALENNFPMILTNDCLTPGQYIMTNEGAKLVENVGEGDLVLTHRGRYQPVITSVNRNYSGQTYSFKVKQTKKTVTLTEEHPVHVSTVEGHLSWKKAKDVLLTDLVTFPRQALGKTFIHLKDHMPSFIQLLDFDKVLKKKRHNRDREVLYEGIPPSFEIDDDLAWLLGWFTAEGSTWEQKSTLTSIRSGFNFALSSQEKEVAVKLVEVIKTKFSYEPKINYFDNWTEVRGNNICLAYLFSGLCGIGSRNKRIPEEIKASSKLDIYLQSLFEGDGSNSKTTQLATSSIMLAYDVKQALASSGYWANVSHIKRKCQTGVFDQYLISYTPSVEPTKWRCFPNFIAREISTIIVQSYTGPVYNFEVNEDNTYVSEFTIHNCHYAYEHDKMHHEAALCLQTKTTLNNPKRFTFGEIKVHMADHDWMWNEARAQNMPYDVISNTIHLADAIDSDSYFMDRMNRYPKFKDLPKEWSSIDFLATESQHGLFNRFKAMPPLEYQERLNHELKIIKKMGFSDYLLIVAQFMNGAKERGVLHGPGRGSAAGSLIAYALGITEVDPIKYGLIFERFLNEGRGSTPLIFNKKMSELADSFAVPF